MYRENAVTSFMQPEAEFLARICDSDARPGGCKQRVIAHSLAQRCVSAEKPLFGRLAMPG